MRLGREGRGGNEMGEMEMEMGDGWQTRRRLFGRFCCDYFLTTTATFLGQIRSVRLRLFFLGRICFVQKLYIKGTGLIMCRELG